MVNRVGRWGCAVVAAVVLAVGCGCSAGGNQETAGAPALSSTVAGGSAGPAPSRTAPAVRRTLDISAWRDRPCRLLLPGDLTVLGLGETFDVNLVPNGCSYLAAVGKGELVIRLETDRSPLVAAYATEPERYELFQPFEVQGVPAVAEAETRAGRNCVVAIGTGQSAGITLIKYADLGYVPGGSAAVCDQLKALAEAAVVKLAA